MTRSAWAQVRPLLRYRRARVAFALAVAVPLAATVPQQLQAPYPVPDAVTNSLFWYLRLCLLALPLVIASSIAGQHERGVRRQRVLDGEPEIHQTCAAVVVFAAAAGFAAVSVVVLEAGIAATATTFAATDYASPWNVGQLATASLLTVLVALSVGVLAGSLSSRTVNAAVLALGLAVPGSLLGAASDLVPSLNYVVAALPQGVFTLVDRGGGNGAGELDIATAAVVAWPALAVLATVVSAARMPRVQLAYGRRRVVHLGPALMVPAAVALVAIGFAVPVALRDQIPWQYRPTWLADKAAHRTSVDIAAKFVAAVKDGQLRTADALTRSGDAVTLLGPYRRAAENGDMTVLQLPDTERLEPGEVPVNVPGRQIHMCLTRSDGRWTIIDLGTARACPEATSR